MSDKSGKSPRGTPGACHHQGMAYAARNIRPGWPARMRSRHRHIVTVRSVVAEPAALGAMVLAEPVAVPAVASHAAWARTLRRFARAAVWALPAAAAALAVLSLQRVPAADSPSFAYVVTADRFRLSHAAGAAAAWLGLVGLVALTALLAGTRGRRWATGGLLAGGLGATVLALPVYGLGAFARPAVGWAYLRGDWAVALAVDEGMYGTATRTVVLVAAALGTLAWALTGMAVLRGGVLNRADGVLLLVAAPLVGIGGAMIGFLLTIGALLLLAAALGLAWTAARLTHAYR